MLAAYLLLELRAIYSAIRTATATATYLFMGKNIGGSILMYAIDGSATQVPLT